ncbi:p166 protein [Trypanosoma brucei equiperdum]|nr:p166 protein [Trypanosoma brucei equiperdum]
MIAALRSTVDEATTQQMRTFTQQFTWQKEREETNKEAVMRSVQQVSQEVGKLQSMSSEVRTAVTSSSAGVVQEVRNAQKDLAMLFEKRLAAVLEQQKKQQVVQVLSPVRVGEADSSNGIPSETTDTPSLVTMVNPQGASHLSWFLLSQSVVTIITIMLCAYFLFAAFLVAFVPIPLTDEFASHMEQAADNDVSEIALKRPLVSRVADRVIL